MTDFDFAALAPKERYKLLTALVVPRPIALVSTMSPAGVVNAAPYSFFNVFSEEPALVVLGLEIKAPNTLKDTAQNIRDTGVFVVNLVDEAIANAMNVCAVDFPPEVSELEPAGFTAAPSAVAAPRLAEAPAALACRKYTALEVGRGRQLMLGEVVALHVRDGLIDPATLRLDWERYAPIGRLFADLYCRTDATFELVRETHEQWRERRERAP